MHVIIKEFKRTARHNWCCDKCHDIILAGTQYCDKEIHHIKHVSGGVVSFIEHERFCAVCAGYIKEPKIYKFNEPEPVSSDGIKYYLIGTGYEKGVLKLIIEDWVTNKKHWADEVYNHNGDKLTIKNVRFV